VRARAGFRRREQNVPLKEKHRRARKQQWPGYAVFEAGPVFRKRRTRARLFVYVLLLALMSLGGFAYLSAGTSDETDNDPTEQQQVDVGQEGAEDTATEEGETGSAVPDDPTLYLTVPRLGIQGHTVRNDDSEEAMGLGAIKLPTTGFPWQKGDTNTYIACHRLGFPGTESYNQCLNLPSMQKGDDVFLADANGTVYKYRVTTILTVGPEDTWVTQPVEGKEVVSLQTCLESFNDVYTLGPNWGARLVVQADRVA
jgi:sortase A